MKLLLHLSVLFCVSPLSTPIFRRKGNSHVAEVPFTRAVDVVSHQIMVGNMSASENDFTTLDRRRDQHGVRDSIKVKLDAIKDKSDKKQYSICVEENNGKKNVKWYSETFRFDDRKNNWVLKRAYEEDPWYIKYQLYIIGGSVVTAIGLIGFLAFRYIKPKAEDAGL